MYAEKLTGGHSEGFHLRYDVLALWAILHAALITSLLSNHISLEPTIAGRYSVGFVLLVVLIAAWAIGAALLVIGLRQMPQDRFELRLGRLGKLRQSRLFRALVIIAATAFMCLYWLRFPDILRDVPHPYLRFCLSISILAVVYFGLFWRASDPVLRWRTWLLIGSIGIAIGLVISIHFNGTYPMLDTLDELHNYIVQWTYAHTSLLGDWVFREMVPLPQPLYDLSHILVGLLMRLVGDGLWQARLLRLMLVSVSLPFIYNSGKLLYGRRAGLFAVAAAIAYIAATAYARPDFTVGVLLSIGLYIYLKARQIDHPLIRLAGLRADGTRFSPVLHFLAGLIIAAGVEGHLLAYRFGAGFGLIYLASWAQAIWQRKRIFIDGRLVALGLGAFLALLIYTSVHVLPGPEQALHFLQSYSPTARDTTQQTSAAVQIVSRQIEVWLETSPIEVWLTVAALVLAMVRFQRGDRLILTLLVVSEILMIVTYGYYRAFYQVHYLPLVALLMGKTLADGFDMAADPRPAAGRLSQLVMAGMVLVVIFSVLTDDANTTTDPMRTEFEAVGTQLSDTLPANAVVLANEDYFLTGPKQNFYTIQSIATPTWFIPTVQGMALLEQIKPDVIIISPEIDIPRYTPMEDIYTYMDENNFQEVRCYTATGQINAQVWMATLPPGWKIDPTCKSYGTLSGF